MADVIMPQMGESIAEGTVTKWLKNVGDKVERDEPLFEISTDKVDAEIPSPVAGILKEIRVTPGTTVAVNSVVGVVAEAGEAEAAPPSPPAEAGAPEAPPAPPQPADAPPQQPAPPQPAAAPPQQPATPPQPAAAPPQQTAPPPQPGAPPQPPAAPARPPTTSGATPPPLPAGAPASAPAGPGSGPTTLRPSLPSPPAPPSAETGRTAAQDVPPVEYQIEDERPGPRPAAAPPGEDERDRPREDMTAEELRQVRSSPVVRRIAAEHQVDIRGLQGTGIGGRVTKQDILGHIEGKGAPAREEAAAAPTAAAPSAPPPPAPAAPAIPGRAPSATAAPSQAPAAPAPGAQPPASGAAPAPAAAGARVEVVPMSPIRRRTAEHMVLSSRTSAHVSTVFEIDMTRVDQLRQAHRRAFEERGVRLTYVPFILKAVVDALKAFPVVNASVDGESIVYHKDVNLGVAVALDWGLIVPVIHHADEKNVLGLARAVADLAERARARKLRVEEVQGGTFTITNPGVFGSLFGTPIINQPQVAILDVGTIEKRPVVRDDAIAIRTMAYFALTFDHRLVDGADADRFMAHVKATLQEFDEAAL